MVETVIQQISEPPPIEDDRYMLPVESENDGLLCTFNNTLIQVVVAPNSLILGDCTVRKIKSKDSDRPIKQNTFKRKNCLQSQSTY